MSAPTALLSSLQSVKANVATQRTTTKGHHQQVARGVVQMRTTVQAGPPTTAVLAPIAQAVTSSKSALKTSINNLATAKRDKKAILSQLRGLYQ